MLRKAIITLIILAFTFSIISIMTGSIGMKTITTQTIRNDIPTFFSFLTVVFIMVIILLILIDFILFFKKK